MFIMSTHIIEYYSVPTTPAPAAVIKKATPSTPVIKIYPQASFYEEPRQVILKPIHTLGILYDYNELWDHLIGTVIGYMVGVISS
jgi:hypothetical protein